MVFLFVAEFSTFINPQVRSEMFVDINRGGDKLTVNMDIVLMRYPCDIVSVDVQDIVGSHTVNVGGTLYKRRLKKDGTVISEAKHEPAQGHGDDHHEHGTPSSFDFARAIQAIHEEEGCQLVGHIIINKVSSLLAV
jgi:hypothetical protein